MQVVHVTETGAEMVLGDSVRFADGIISRALGLMGRTSLEDGEAMVFRFASARPRRVHTMFVRDRIDVIWLEAERVNGLRTMEPWSIGPARRGDTVIELPAGMARNVNVGDVVRLESSDAI